MIFRPISLLRLAALLPDEEEAIRAAGERLKLSNADRARLLDSVAVGGKTTASHFRRATCANCSIASVWPASGIGCCCAGRQAPEERARFRGACCCPLTDGWERPKFPLTGLDVMTAGVPEGPAVGQVLHALEEWWMDKDFPDDAPALSAKLKAIVQAGEF